MTETNQVAMTSDSPSLLMIYSGGVSYPLPIRRIGTRFPLTRPTMTKEPTIVRLIVRRRWRRLTPRPAGLPIDRRNLAQPSDRGFENQGRESQRGTSAARGRQPEASGSGFPARYGSRTRLARRDDKLLGPLFFDDRERPPPLPRRQPGVGGSPFGVPERRPPSTRPRPDRGLGGPSPQPAVGVAAAGVTSPPLSGTVGATTPSLVTAATKNPASAVVAGWTTARTGVPGDSSVTVKAAGVLGGSSAVRPVERVGGQDVFFSSLAAGDLVIHSTHGLARFQGIEQLDYLNSGGMPPGRAGVGLDDDTPRCIVLEFAVRHAVGRVRGWLKARG